MKLISKNCFYNQHGTRKSRFVIEGDYNLEELMAELATDAPYGCHISLTHTDEELNRHEGEIHEYWD